MPTFRWQYQENGVFYDFDEGTSRYLEDQYIRQPFATLKVPIFGAVYEIDFSSFTRTDVRRGKQEKIQRLSNESSVPSLANEMLKPKSIYVWHYNDNGYRKLDPQTSAKFERTFSKNPLAKFLVQIMSVKFIVDFASMTLTSYEDQSTHQLLRMDINQQGFVPPKALDKAKRNIVPGKVTGNKPVRTPLERTLRKMLEVLPTAPKFATVTLATPNVSLFNVSNTLPVLQASSYEHKSTCAICYDVILHPKTPQNAATFDDIDDYDPSYHCKATCLPCGHVFHHVCAAESLKASARCPGCRASASTLFGSQPEGNMTITYNSSNVSGFKNSNGSISCSFNMDGGVQTSRHPHPGIHYSGDSRNCYFPCTAQGFLALRWCALAWLHFTLFAIGYSGTRNQDDVVVYNLHIKTDLSGGEHGYPDKGYLKRFYDECTEQGVPLQMPYDPLLDDASYETLSSMDLNEGDTIDDLGLDML